MTTTQQQVRIALLEIPDRLEVLRLAAITPTIPNRRTADEPTPANTFNNTAHNNNNVMLLDNTANVVLAHDLVMSPLAASPDELLIRQRGRRRLTTTWSPDQTGSLVAGGSGTTTTARSPFQRTPTKMPLTSGMILRSSPRKRLTMGSTPPDLSTPFGLESPTKAGANQQLWPGTPIVKKLRLDKDDEQQLPLAQLNNDTPLSHILQGMSQQQLIDLIVGKLVAGDARAENQLRSHLPLPDIEPLEIELLHAKRNIFRSLPTSRLCRKTDSTAYSRAALHLTEFKRLLGAQAKQLHDSANWDALLEYVTMAWNCVRSTPQWDSGTHNAVRRQCFKLLSCHCIAAVKHGGLRLGPARLHTLERNLSEWSKDYEEVLSCVNTLNRTLTKGRSTL